MGPLEIASEVEIYFGRFLEGCRSGEREKVTALYLPQRPRPVPGSSELGHLSGHSDRGKGLDLFTPHGLIPGYGLDLG